MCAFHPIEPGISDSTDTRTFCAVHTTVESTLRCNKCGRYMCARCAVRTPVGYRCKQCVHQQQDIYFNAGQRDYIISAAVSFVLSVGLSFVAFRLDSLFINIFLGLIGGGVIGEMTHRAVGKRRGRYIWLAATLGVVAGAMVAILPYLQDIFLLMNVTKEMARQPQFQGASGDLISYLITPIVFVVLCAGATIARLRHGN